MKLHVIVNTNLILLHFTSAFYDGFIRSRYGLSKGISENVTVLSDVHINSVCQNHTKKCLWRCCPPGKHIMARKECKPSNISFANVTVYDEYFQNTSKSLETVFQLVSGIMSDKVFAKNAFPYSFLAQPYLVEDGNLYLEMPNSFHRWVKIETNHFCVDMKVSKQGVSPVFMAEMRKEIRGVYDIVNYGYALDVTVCFLLLTILPYALFPQLRDINGAIFIIFLTFFATHMIIVIHTLSFGTSTLLGFLITGILYYFCFVSSICWTNVMFYRILTSNNTRDWTMKEVILYCVYAVGIPLSLATLVAVTEITDMTHIPWFVTPKIVEFGLCFFDGMESLYYLYIPLGLLLLFNWIVCVVNVVRFFKTFNGFQIVKVKKNEREFISPLAKTTQYVKLLILLTMYGVVNVLTTVYPHYDRGSDVCFFFTLFIGPVIFITFVIDKNVFKMAKQFYGKFRSGSKFNLSSRSVQSRNGNPILENQ